MKVRLRSVSGVLIGLDRVGLVGLEQAFEKADASGLDSREELVSLLLEALSSRNYIAAASQDEYRQAVWREYQRHRGEDIRDLYSEIEVAVRGDAGEDAARGGPRHPPRAGREGPVDHPQGAGAVRGEAGEDRERIVGAVAAVLAEHELAPRFRYEAADPAGVNPLVSIAGQVVVRGIRSESAIRKAVKARIDDW